MTHRKSTVILLDDQASPRRDLEQALAEDSHVRLLAHTSMAGHDTLAAIARHPDVIVMDVERPNDESCVLAYWIHAMTSAPIVFVSRDESNEEVLELIHSGVQCYVARGDQGHLVEAIHAATKGLPYITPEVLRRLIQVFSSPSSLQGELAISR